MTEKQTVKCANCGVIYDPTTLPLPACKADTPLPPDAESFMRCVNSVKPKALTELTRTDKPTTERPDALPRCEPTRHYWPEDYTAGDSCDCGALYLHAGPVVGIDQDGDSRPADGVSLLQWYTGHALAGLLASEANVDLARVRKQAAAENGLTYSEQIGVEAVELARCAMLAARKAGGR